jgi:hypothetical protein
MPYAKYLPEQMGTATITPEGPFEAGSYASLALTYTAGFFGIDDSGHLKISWRTTSDMGKPQLTNPDAPNYTTITASNGAELETRIDRVNIRPWANTLFIRVGRGFLRAGDTITVRFGDTSGGSPGLRLQTNREPHFTFKVVVDAFATYEFTELPVSPSIALVPGPPARWKALWPTLVQVGVPFRLAIVAEDRWGNPTDRADTTMRLACSRPVEGLPQQVRFRPGNGPVVLEPLAVRDPADIVLTMRDAQDRVLGQSNPLRAVAAPPLLHYWGDLHGQSEETIGTNSVEDYFQYARDLAFLDIVGHQGNDFQITDAFWEKLNRLMREYHAPRRFVTVPGYEWSGNTGLGGDRNVFFMQEDRPIRRSARILVDGIAENTECYTAADLFDALRDEDAVVIAHVGGRYADIRKAHAPRLECAVEVHSTWGTFEWLLHDAFDLGYRVGVVCHSDDHKGRPGATRPGASHFGAIGGLTCYLMPELTREAVFRALRGRRHYGTTGTRMFLSLTGDFAEPVTVFADDPALGPAAETQQQQVGMGDIVRPGSVPMRLTVQAIGSAPVERIDIFHGKQRVRTIRPFTEGSLGQRIRVLWEGAEYRGRGREVLWRGKATLHGARYGRAEAVNFLNPEQRLTVQGDGAGLAWQSVTTGNMAGFDLWLEGDGTGTLGIETNVVSGQVDLAQIGIDDHVLDGGGLGRRIRIFRLPDSNEATRLDFTHDVRFEGSSDLPVYVRVTQEDGHQAWSSPIYLIG